MNPDNIKVTFGKELQGLLEAEKTLFEPIGDMFYTYIGISFLALILILFTLYKITIKVIEYKIEKNQNRAYENERMYKYMAEKKNRK